MLEFFSMGYASFVYSSFFIFFLVLLICTKQSVALNKKYHRKVKMLIDQTDTK